MDERNIGFIQGVAYSAGLMKRFSMDSKQLLKESGITEEDLRKYVDRYDLVNLGLISEE
jgi:hypothetical protein